MGNEFLWIPAGSKTWTSTVPLAVQAAPAQAVAQNFIFSHGPPAPLGSSASHTCPLHVFPALHPSFLTGPSTAPIPRGDQLVRDLWWHVGIFNGIFYVQVLEMITLLFQWLLNGGTVTFNGAFSKF